MARISSYDTNFTNRAAHGLRAVGVVITFFISLLSFITSSCSSIDCPVQNTVAVYYGISQRDAAGELVADTLTDTLWVWTQRADGEDTLLLNRLIDKSDFSLPISYNHPEDMLVFAIRDIAQVWTLDTVWLKKEDIPHFESVDCSAHFFHELTAVRCTHEGIDSLVISNPSVTYETGITNLLIFFKERSWLNTPAEEEDEIDDTDEETDE